MCGLLDPDEGYFWGNSWLEARSELGLVASQDQYLIPMLGKNDQFFPLQSATSEDITYYLRDALIGQGVPVHIACEYTSHSLKATILSWAAKAGLPMGVRRHLGGHAISKDSV